MNITKVFNFVSSVEKSFNSLGRLATTVFDKYVKRRTLFEPIKEQLLYHPKYYDHKIVRKTVHREHDGLNWKTVVVISIEQKSGYSKEELERHKENTKVDPSNVSYETSSFGYNDNLSESIKEEEPLYPKDKRSGL